MPAAGLLLWAARLLCWRLTPAALEFPNSAGFPFDIVHRQV